MTAGTHIHTYIHTYTHTCIHACMLTYTHTNKNTDTDTHTYTHDISECGRLVKLIALLSVRGRPLDWPDCLSAVEIMKARSRNDQYLPAAAPGFVQQGAFRGSSQAFIQGSSARLRRSEARSCF